MHRWECKVSSPLFHVGALYQCKGRVYLSDWKCKAINITYVSHKEYKFLTILLCLKEQFQSED